MSASRWHFSIRPVLAIFPTTDWFPPLPAYARQLLAEFTNPPLRLGDLS
jgi:hypothetical protein